MCEDTNWPHAMGTSAARGSTGFIGFTAPAAAGVSARAPRVRVGRARRADLFLTMAFWADGCGAQL